MNTIDEDDIPYDLGVDRIGLFGEDEFNHCYVVREDLKGDASLSGMLVTEAYYDRWPEVEELLEHGADPRICRRCEGVGCESALYYALRAERFDMAEKLYKAGDRLDDLVVTEITRNHQETISAYTLTFLADCMKHGFNYFVDESKILGTPAVGSVKSTNKTKRRLKNG